MADKIRIKGNPTKQQALKLKESSSSVIVSKKEQIQIDEQPQKFKDQEELPLQQQQEKEQKDPEIGSLSVQGVSIDPVKEESQPSAMNEVPKDVVADFQEVQFKDQRLLQDQILNTDVTESSAFVTSTEQQVSEQQPDISQSQGPQPNAEDNTSPEKEKSSNILSVSRIRELEKERKQRQEKRLQKAAQNEYLLRKLAAEEQAQKAEEPLKRREEHKQLSLKAMEELNAQKSQRQKLLLEGNKSLKEVLKSKPLYVERMQEFNQQTNNDLEIKKQQLLRIREAFQPMNFEELQQHQVEYELKKKQQLHELSSKRQEQTVTLHSGKPSYSSRTYELYKSEFEKEENAVQIKEENAAKIEERRKYYAMRIKSNYVPKVLVKKESNEIDEEGNQKSNRKLRQSSTKEMRVKQGNEQFLEGLARRATTERKELHKTTSKDDGGYDEYSNPSSKDTLGGESLTSLGGIVTHKDVTLPKIASSKMTNFQVDSRVKGNRSGSLDNSYFSMSQISQGSQRAMRLRNSYTDQQYQQILRLSTVELQDDDEKEKLNQFEFAKKEHRKKLGEQYLHNLTQNIHHKSLVDLLKEDGVPVDESSQSPLLKSKSRTRISRNENSQNMDLRSQRSSQCFEQSSSEQVVRQIVAKRYLSQIQNGLAELESFQSASSANLQGTNLVRDNSQSRLSNQGMSPKPFLKKSRVLTNSSSQLLYSSPSPVKINSNTRVFLNGYEEFQELKKKQTEIKQQQLKNQMSPSIGSGTGQSMDSQQQAERKGSIQDKELTFTQRSDQVQNDMIEQQQQMEQQQQDQLKGKQTLSSGNQLKQTNAQQQQDLTINRAKGANSPVKLGQQSSQDVQSKQQITILQTPQILGENTITQQQSGLNQHPHNGDMHPQVSEFQPGNIIDSSKQKPSSGILKISKDHTESPNNQLKSQKNEELKGSLLNFGGISPVKIKDGGDQFSSFSNSNIMSQKSDKKTNNLQVNWKEAANNNNNNNITAVINEKDNNTQGSNSSKTNNKGINSILKNANYSNGKSQNGIVDIKVNSDDNSPIYNNSNHTKQDDQTISKNGGGQNSNALDDKTTTKPNKITSNVPQSIQIMENHNEKQQQQNSEIQGRKPLILLQPVQSANGMAQGKPVIAKTGSSQVLPENNTLPQKALPNTPSKFLSESPKKITNPLVLLQSNTTSGVVSNATPSNTFKLDQVFPKTINANSSQVSPVKLQPSQDKVTTIDVSPISSESPKKQAEVSQEFQILGMKIRIKSIEKIPENITAVTYGVKLLCENKIIQDQAKKNIDVESDEIVEADKESRKAVINDNVSIRYQQEDIFKDFAAKKEKVFIAIKIIGENEKDEEVDLGWNIIPVFLKDNINYGSFSLPLIVPTQPMTAPIKDPKKAKTLQTVVNLDFQEWKEII